VLCVCSVCVCVQCVYACMFWLFGWLSVWLHGWLACLLSGRMTWLSHIRWPTSFSGCLFCCLEVLCWFAGLFAVLTDVFIKPVCVSGVCVVCVRLSAREPAKICIILHLQTMQP